MSFFLFEIKAWYWLSQFAASSLFFATTFSGYSMTMLSAMNDMLASGVEYLLSNKTEQRPWTRDCNLAPCWFNVFTSEEIRDSVCLSRRNGNVFSSMKVYCSNAKMEMQGFS